MKLAKLIIFFLTLILISTKISYSKDPSKLIEEIVEEASLILSSSDPVEAKIIKLNNLAEINKLLPRCHTTILVQFKKN